MAEMKKKRPNIVVRGTAAWPKTNKPVTYDKVAKRSVYDPDGKYEVDVIIDAEQKEAIENKLRDYANSAGQKKLKNLPFKEQEDSEGEPTGKWVIKAKQYGKKKDGRVNRVAHFDGAAKPLGKDFVLTSGSEVILSAYPNAYAELGGGVNLFIDGIQVLKYAEYENNPFTAQEGAWTSEDNYDEDDDDSSDDGENGEEDNDDPKDF